MEALGYRGITSMTEEEREARERRAAKVLESNRSFFPGTQIGVLAPWGKPLRLKRVHAEG